MDTPPAPFERADPGDRFVYKIFREDEHALFLNFGRFAGSPDDARDGFIHLSFHRQLAGTLTKHFGECPVTVVAFDPQDLGDVRVEGESDAFPHLYDAALLLSTARASWDLTWEQSEPRVLARSEP